MLRHAQTCNVAGLALAGSPASPTAGMSRKLKRGFDLGIAASALAALLPVFVLVALVVRASSRGPILFRQVRVGRHGRQFTLLKFRSMHAQSDPGIHREFAADWIHGRTGPNRPQPRSVGAAAAKSAAPPVHKLTDDPRITAVGRLLRRTSLDELPQLWNVLRGEMSIVGPRPALPYEVERYSEWHKRRLEALPGMTGLWQVSGRNLLSFEEMVRLDIQYIDTRSLWQDIRILLRTVPAVFRQAY